MNLLERRRSISRPAKEQSQTTMPYQQEIAATPRSQSRSILFTEKPLHRLRRCLRSQLSSLEIIHHSQAPCCLLYQRSHLIERNILRLKWTHVFLQHRRRRDRMATWDRQSMGTKKSTMRADRRLHPQHQATPVGRGMYEESHRRNLCQLQRTTLTRDLDGPRIERLGNEGTPCVRTYRQIQQPNLAGMVASRMRNLTSGGEKLRTF